MTFPYTDFMDEGDGSEMPADMMPLDAEEFPSETEAGEQNEASPADRPVRVSPLVMENTDSGDALFEAMYGRECVIKPSECDANGVFQYDMDDDSVHAKCAAWADSLWSMGNDAVELRMRAVIRSRLFAAGRHHMSYLARNRLFIDTPRNPNDARATYNVITPALALRTQLISEQRPGFRTNPTSRDPDSLKRAQAQQDALEYQWRIQDMQTTLKTMDAIRSTDGMVWARVWWDNNAGPTEASQIGGEVEIELPAGDIATTTYRIEQVRVTPGTTMTERPLWMVLKRKIGAMQAASRYGVVIIDDLPGDTATRTPSDPNSQNSYFGTNPDTLHNTPTVEECIVYVQPCDAFPSGLEMVLVNGRVVYFYGLRVPTIPVVAIPDGAVSTDYYQPAEMEDWLDHQIRMNAVLTKWVRNLSVNSVGRLMVSGANTILRESTGVGEMTLLQVDGPLSSDRIKEMQPFSLNVDAKELFRMELAAFEQKSGWNEVTRGSFASGASGRAILAAREQVERIFFPRVMAMATGMTEWAMLNLYWMKWGYDDERRIGVMGKGRPDLARALVADDFNDIADVTIDEETMVPLPRTVRLFLLEQQLEKGLMTPADFKRRSPFGYIGSMETDDDMQEARAQRIADRMFNGDAALLADPASDIRWTDDEAINQSVLERIILLRDDIAPEILQAATARWQALAGQAAQKQGAVAPQPPDGAPSGAGGAEGLPPESQPLSGLSPSVASAPTELMMPDSGEFAPQEAFSVR